MRKAIRRARAAAGERDRGWTLIELMVAMSLFIGILTIVFAILITVSQQSRDNLARDLSVTQARLALMQIDRQVRSGNVISDPEWEPPANADVGPYYSLRVYTQTDGVYQCVQWRVIFPTGSQYGTLQYRSWKKTWQSTGGVSDWRVVARNVVKPESSTIVPLDPATWPPFYVDQTVYAGSKAQTIRVTMRLKDPGARASSEPVSVTSVLTGRNTVFGYDADECAVVPPP